MDRADVISKYIKLKKEFKELVLKKYDNKGKLSEPEQARLDDLDKEIFEVRQFVKPEYLSEIYRKMYGKDRSETSEIDRKIAIRAAREILKARRDTESKGTKK